jgi:hypothetical protein
VNPAAHAETATYRELEKHIECWERRIHRY